MKVTDNDGLVVASDVLFINDLRETVILPLFFIYGFYVKNNVIHSALSAYMNALK